MSFYRLSSRNYYTRSGRHLYCIHLQHEGGAVSETSWRADLTESTPERRQDIQRALDRINEAGKAGDVTFFWDFPGLFLHA